MSYLCYLFQARFDYMSSVGSFLKEAGTTYPSPAHGLTLGFFVRGVRVAHHFSFLCCVFVLCLSLSCVLCAQCFVCLCPVSCVLNVLFVFVLYLVCSMFCLSLSCVLCAQCFVCLCPVSCVPNVLFVFVLCLVCPMFCLSLSCVLCAQCSQYLLITTSVYILYIVK
jgi:hypothetical protein